MLTAIDEYESSRLAFDLSAEITGIGLLNDISIKKPIKLKFHMETLYGGATKVS